MEINAVKFVRDGYYSAPFAFGGEEGQEKYDVKERYRGSLQNYLIDTGSEVILVDTGLPAGTEEGVPTEDALAFIGYNICDYMTAFENLGYKPEQVTKILLTHRHADHSGCIDKFPNAKIYVGEEEVSADELKGVNNIVPVKYTDGAYYNFPESQKIVDGVYFIRAKGHTNGNSLVIVENDGLFYMLQADITYVDEALYKNKISIVYDDLKASRETMDMVREFISKHPTVYCGTHTPQGYENLEGKKVIDLNNMPETIPVGEIAFKTKTGKYVCSVCGYVYDPEVGDPENGIAPHTKFEDLPADWHCPRCKQDKSKFNPA